MTRTNQERNKYEEDYKNRNYDRVNLLLPKGQRDTLRAIATNAGISVNAWINKAIQEKIERDSISDPDSTDSE